jgi:PAS domain S-box-containing protein
MAALQDIQGHFRMFAEALPHIAWMTDPYGGGAYFNQRWYDFTGLERSSATGSQWIAAVDPDHRPDIESAWAEALSSRRLFEAELRMRSADGEYRWFAARAEPIRGPSGEILLWLVTSTDIDKRKRAESALRQFEGQHRLALDAGELGSWAYRAAGGMLELDERACAILGAGSPARAVPLDEILAQIHEEDRSQVRAVLVAVPQQDFDLEFRVVDRDRVRWLRACGQALPECDSDAGRPARWSGVISDITERRAGDEARLHVARELNHRVKNLFAIANGLVSMTARSAKDPKEMAEALRGRLGALSRAHELARPTFGADEQPGQATTLGRLIASILDPYAPAGHGSRLTLHGPQVSLGANAVTSLGLVLHELATNAAKYGSLSQADGSLAIQWTVDDSQVALSWTETGGPPVPEAPTLQGFGSQLSRKSITGQLAGGLDYEWRPEGLQVRIALPLDRISI